ncbi:hypothetical protein BIWAKO_04386 [Bosea sp. BIWAKO-01]|nr:hypothetical protein BIWAKO_04386 [Bosea sp. BIWAKO-01]
MKHYDCGRCHLWSRPDVSCDRSRAKAKAVTGIGPSFRGQPPPDPCSATHLGPREMRGAASREVSGSRPRFCPKRTGTA